MADKTTGATVIETLTHFQIHNKQLVYAIKENAALANNAFLTFYVFVDPAFKAHLRMIMVCGGNALATLEKFSVAPTVPTGANVVYSRKFQKVVTTEATVKLYDSVIGGTLAQVWTKRVPGGTGGNSVGGANGTEPELVLEEGYWYKVSLQNVSGVAQDTELELLWYEKSGAKNVDGNYDNLTLKAAI